jgi:hypothetical protein
MLEVRDGPEAAILEMEKCANDLKTVVDVSEDELCFRIHDIAAALELSIKYSGGAALAWEEKVAAAARFLTHKLLSELETAINLREVEREAAPWLEMSG